MTRENKLALVVGFGLILLVGILVSDHFSDARRQETAELTRVVDPLSAARHAQPDLIAVRSLQPNPTPVASAPPPMAEVRPLTPGIIEMGAVRPARVGLAAAETATLPDTFHEVRKGEVLAHICRDRFGDPSLATELARYNGLDDPNAVPAGMRLRIPAAETLTRGRPSPAGTGASRPVGRARPVDPAPPPAKPDPTYTVKEGDVLTEIARRLLGSSRKYLSIYEGNRDVLASPDALVPGMKLRIPREAP